MIGLLNAPRVLKVLVQLVHPDRVVDLPFVVVEATARAVDLSHHLIDDGDGHNGSNDRHHCYNRSDCCKATQAPKKSSDPLPPIGTTENPIPQPRGESRLLGRRLLPVVVVVAIGVGRGRELLLVLRILPGVDLLMVLLLVLLLVVELLLLILIRLLLVEALVPDSHGQHGQQHARDQLHGDTVTADNATSAKCGCLHAVNDTDLSI